MKYLMFLCFGLIGCYTPQKARRGMDKAMSVHPAVAAEFCSDNFPPKLDTTTTVKYLTVKCPPLPESKGDSGKIIEPAPPKKVIKSIEPSKEKKDTSQTVVLNHGEEIDIPIETIQPTIQSTSALAACEERAKLEISKWSKKVQKQTKWKNIWFGVAMVLLGIHLFRIIIRR